MLFSVTNCKRNRESALSTRKKRFFTIDIRQLQAHQSEVLAFKAIVVALVNKTTATAEATEMTALTTLRIGVKNDTREKETALPRSQGERALRKVWEVRPPEQRLGELCI